MFSGIVEEAATVASHLLSRDICELTIESALDHEATSIGDSIAIDGVCLTVVQKKGTTPHTELIFQVSQETLRRSTLGQLAVGDLVHCERSLVVGERVHGHFVFGHVDGVVSLVSSEKEGDTLRLCWSLPQELSVYLVSKGSVALGGVSLTVGEVEDAFFSVYVVPHTNNVTKLGKVSIGDTMNIEIDMLARYIHGVAGASL